MRHLPCLLLCLALGACTEIPDIPDPLAGTDRTQGYPTFVRLDEVTLNVNDKDLTAQNVAARVANLRARAAQLKSVQFD